MVHFVARSRTKGCATTPISAVSVLHGWNAGGSGTIAEGRAARPYDIAYHSSMQTDTHKALRLPLMLRDVPNRCMLL